MKNVAETPPRPQIVNIAEHLSRMAERYPDKRAVVHAVGRRPHKHLTFRELARQSDSYAHGLERIGIRRGTRTILMVRPSLELFALTFALFKVGAVPVLIDPGMGRQNLVDCLATVEAEAFIGIPLAHALRTLHRRAFESVKTCVTVGPHLWWGGHRLGDIASDSSEPYATASTGADETAAILFTSGSTGPAKGVVYTHGIFDAQVRYLHSHFGYGPDEVDLASFPLFALFDTALGMTAVIPDMDASRPGSADPRKIIETIRNCECTHMFGSPALLDRVSRYGEAHRVKLPTLRRVITAGAPVQPALLERMHKLLPDEAEVHTPYGATESLPVASIGSREILGETRELTARGGGTCVGRPMRGIDVRIIAITDEPVADWKNARELPTGEIGEITVKGPVVTREYFRRPEVTALAKIRDGDAIVHRMGDVGYLDERGRLWFCGRKAHRVITEQGALFTVPCEAIFNQHPRVRRSALVGVGKPEQQRPVICVELEPDDRGDRKDELTNELRKLAADNELTREIKTVLYHRSFPVDVRHNAKIFREKLAVWAMERLR
ncbi:MAG: AMP-binding protein [Planctomycetes bacterium]|nr:AMP-binding protein [Planctomycetota bacterium]